MSKGSKSILMKISGNVHNDRWVHSDDVPYPGGTSEDQSQEALIVKQLSMLSNLLLLMPVCCITIYNIWISEFLLNFFNFAGRCALIECFPVIDCTKVTPPPADVAPTCLWWTVALSVWLCYTCSVNVDLMVQITLFPKEWEREREGQSHIDFPDLTDSV